MGCCPCFGNKQEYTPIPDKEKGVEVQVSPQISTTSYSNSSSSGPPVKSPPSSRVETVNILAAEPKKEPAKARPKTPPQIKSMNPPRPEPPVAETLLEMSPSPVRTEAAETPKPVVARPPTPPELDVPAKQSNPQPTPPQTVSPAPKSTSPTPSSSVVKPYNENLPVFKGTLVEQKFSNKSSYDTKFAWINWEGKSLNLSEHMTKERRHKEASLVDVVNVVRGAPEKFKSNASPNGGPPVFQEPHLCLSVKFVRGGGIDLKFKTESDRDMWFEQINKLIAK